MNLTMGEKIRVILKRRGMTVAQLAEKTGQTRQNLSNKMTRDNFQEQDIRAMAEALDCEYEAYLVMKDTGERVQKMDGGHLCLAVLLLYMGDGFRVALGRANSENDRPPHHPRKVRIELP